MYAIWLWIIIYLGGISALIFVGYLIYRIVREDPGNERMREIAGLIRTGAKTFLKQEYIYLSLFTVIIAVILGIFIEPRPWIALSYVVGTIVSALTGWIGMHAATLANSRTTQASMNKWSRGLTIAFSSGAVMGFSAVGLGILGLATLAFIFPDENYVWLGFAFGSSAVALFLRVGGGVFTKSADIGADLVGKIEKNIPEDDDRNAAAIADNVGDNVGDVAGMGSDLFESYVSTIAAAMVLAMVVLGEFEGFFMPLVLASSGVFTSIIGALLVRPRHEAETYKQQVADAHKIMNRGVLISNTIMVVLSFFIIFLFKGDIGESLKLFGSLLSGLLAGVFISYFTEYYTSPHHKPTQELANVSQTGAAINLMEGISIGMISTVAPILIVCVATVVAYLLNGILGIAIAALGMIINLGILLSMDCYGPIADNAAGIAEMAGLGPKVRERCEALDSVGNTTAALGKGFAIASAALSALAWLATYFKVVPGLKVQDLSIERVDVVVGFFIGAMLTFFLSALIIRGIGKGSSKIVQEVRRQFNEIPGIMERKNKPDYERCIIIATNQALVSMILPGTIVIVTPLILGFTLGPGSVGGVLLGSLATGFILAIMMANSGGAWDNAKKYIEAGHFGGKGTEVHEAAIIGDTVGDAFKDASGPALDILIKLIGKVGVMFGPIFVMLPIFTSLAIV